MFFGALPYALVGILAASPASAPSTRPAASSDKLDIRSEALWKRTSEELRHQFKEDELGDFCRMPEWLEDGLVAHRGMAGKNLKHYRRLYKFAETMKMDKRLIRMISDVMKDVNRWMRTGDLVPPSELCLSPIEVFEKGRIGTVRLAKVQQVIDESNALVVIDVDKEDSDLTEERLVWLANISTANMVDDQPLLGFRAVVVSGTRQYGTVMGSTNTVPMLEPLGLQPYIEGLSELAFVDLVKKAGWTRKEFVLRIEKARVENPSGYLVDLADELEDRLLEASIQRTPVPIETKKAAVRQKT